MALTYLDRVKETSLTSGTGAYALAGAVQGFRAFSAVGNGNTCYYAVTDGNDWEVGLGTYASGSNTLARTSILASSNAGAAVSWGGGARNIWVDVPAALLNLIAANTGSSATTAADVRVNLSSPTTVVSRAAMKALDTTKDKIALFEGSTWLWMTGNYSALVTADTLEGAYVKSTATASSAGAWVRVFTTLNVKWFGAVGDGVVDDAAAINAAVTLAYAHTGGRNVYLPAANYLFGAQIIIPKTAGKTCRFFGDGTNSTTLTIAAALDTTTGAIAVGSGVSAAGCDIAIENLSVTGANTKKAFYLTNANICRFFRVECRTVAIGVQIETSYFVQFRECEFDSCAQYGIVSVTTVHGLRVENTGFYAITGQGIYLAGASPSDNILITGNDFETTTTPVQFDPGVNSLLFTGNYVEFATGALWVFGATSYGVIIEGNWLAYSTATSCNNISTGRLSNNDLYDQTISRGTAGGAFVASNSQIRGTASVTGFGGTVTQATSKSTGVTLNKISGQITTNAASLAAGAEVAFQVTNSDVAATDVVIVHRSSGGTAGSYSVAIDAVAAGSFNVVISNLSAGALAEALVLTFAVIKAVNA